MYDTNTPQTEGSLYLYGDISQKYHDLLLSFQSNLQEIIDQENPGGGFNSWRSFRNEARQSIDGPYRFIDGEFVEGFLQLDEGKQELVCEGLGPTAEDMRNMVEELRRLH